MKDLYILVTMDVEVPQQCPGASGPSDWDFGAAAIQGYTELAAAAGFPVSFFTHPECALKYAPLLERMHDQYGACIEGLHVHPWKFGDRKYRAHMGGLTADEQRMVISEATAMWQAAFGRRPLYFRPGTFSANDSTFPVLVELGFRGGSVSAPGRVYRDLNAIWTGAFPDPHRPHRCFRQLVGDLPFANIPLTQDFSRLDRLGERLYHRDLRPDYDDVDHRLLVKNITRQLAERQPAIPVIHFDTHNDNAYLDPADRVRRNYETVLRAIPELCRQAGFRPVGATVEQVCDLVLSLPVDLPEFVPA
ncbi:MAG TPA: hypothetical protein VNQ76_06275 [Planctomicrobium sp.]|nr:hypothetical protein [Planctomicrobium sp.]